MPLEPSQMNPAMSPDMAAPAQGFDIPAGEVDHEGAMAKADLYKLANYSLKLFKQMEEGDQLESWVQAKITKAADYIASVYHYLQYEMKFSEYGHHLDNSDTINESQRAMLKGKLMEAKAKMKELKKEQADKAKKVDEGILSGGERTCTECGGSGMVYDEPKTVPAHVQGKVEKYKKLVKATHAASKRLDRNKNGIPDDEEVEEGFGDAGDKEMKVGDTKKTRTGELTKTSTGVIHKNTSYHDDGEAEQKSGKGKASHAKSQSSAEKKDRAPALKQSPKSAKTWGMKDSEKFDNRDGAPAKPKKEKEVDEGMVGQGVYEAKGKKPDFLDMDKDGNKKEPMKKAVADKKAGSKKGVNPFAKKESTVKEAAAMWNNIKETQTYIAEKAKAVKDLPGNQEKIDVAEPKGKIDGKDMAALRAKKETVKESTEFTRMQEQLSRLNRSENLQVTESSEVAQLRKLTRLLG